MVLMPPDWDLKMIKLKAELALLYAKEKIFGQLSEADQKRLREILQFLTIKF